MGIHGSARKKVVAQAHFARVFRTSCADGAEGLCRRLESSGALDCTYPLVKYALACRTAPHGMGVRSAWVAVAYTWAQDAEG